MTKNVPVRKRSISLDAEEHILPCSAILMQTQVQCHHNKDKGSKHTGCCENVFFISKIKYHDLNFHDNMCNRTINIAHGKINNNEKQASLAPYFTHIYNHIRL